MSFDQSRNFQTQNLSQSEVHTMITKLNTTSSRSPRSPRSKAFQFNQDRADVYWLELCLRIYFIWCTACVAAINTIFLVNIYVDFILQWEEVHSSFLDWIPFSIDSLSFTYLFFQLIELNYYFISWASYHEILDELTITQIVNQLKQKNEFDTGKISNDTIIQVIANLISSTSFKTRYNIKYLVT